MVRLEITAEKRGRSSSAKIHKLNTQENGSVKKKMEWVSKFGPMGLSMRGSGKTTYLMDLESIQSQTEILLRDSGLMGRLME